METTGFMKMNEVNLKNLALKTIVVSSFKFPHKFYRYGDGYKIFNNVKLLVEDDDKINPDNFQDYPHDVPRSESNRLNLNVALEFCELYKYKRSLGENVMIEPHLISTIYLLLPDSVRLKHEELLDKLEFFSYHMFFIKEKFRSAIQYGDALYTIPDDLECKPFQELQDELLDIAHKYIKDSLQI